MTEQELEDQCLLWLAQTGWEVAYGPEYLEGLSPLRQNADVGLLPWMVREALVNLNPGVSAAGIDDGLRILLDASAPSLIALNQQQHKYITGIIAVQVLAEDGVKTENLRIIDFDNISNNRFLAVNQYTMKGGRPPMRRADIVLFVNGLPLAVLELKNPGSEKATAHMAYNQLQTYFREVPALFHHNTFVIASDGFEAQAGTLTSDWSRYAAWKTIEGRRVEPEIMPQMEVLAHGMLRPNVFLDLLRHFTVFESDGKTTVKKLAAYHQYHAVNTAVNLTVQACSPAGDRRIGVVWHTQGSGKSLSMVFYTGKLIQHPALNNPTVIVITDRNDLDDQLFGTFAKCKHLLSQDPEQISNREELVQKLQGRKTGGVFFSTIQKFLPAEGKTTMDLLSDRSNIIVITDEAHRSQYGFVDGFAKHLRDALPNAGFIGFTGTPIDREDASTQAVFGDYIDVYDIQQAVEDGATVRIYYESRLVKVHLKEDVQEELDEAINILAEPLPDYGEKQAGTSEQLERVKRRLTQLEEVLGHPERIATIAADLTAHFAKRQEVLEGKGMIVCASRHLAVTLGEAILNVRPEWRGTDDTNGGLKVIMTGSASDPEHFQPHIRSKDRQRKIADRLKDPADSLQLVIVCDMWLTGFDAPVLHTLYIDKPMKGHTLAQAIARVNRVYKDKQGGLIVDYVGIATELKKVMHTYSASGGAGKPTLDQEEALSEFLKRYEIITGLFKEKQGFKIDLVGNTAMDARLRHVLEATDYILGMPEGRKRFLDAENALGKAFTLAVPKPEATALAAQVGFFQNMRSRIKKLTESPKALSDQQLETAVRQLVSQAMVTGEVVDVFSAAGLNKPEVSILSEEFLAEIRGMKTRNLAVELLKRLLNDQVKEKERSSIVQSRLFSEMLDAAVKRYQNNLITASQVIEEMIELGRKMREAEKRGRNMGLSNEEMAFYEALEVNDSSVAVLGNDTLCTMARELLVSLQGNARVDWTIREQVQSQMRRDIKRILRKYGYPPDKQVMATETVLLQARHLADELIREL
ncbi:MAG: type I restriction endonuclease subunit R [Bacteroidota bacterium]